MNTMDQIKIRHGKDGKLVSIQEFLKTEGLSGMTKKIQDSLGDLYRMNGENDPTLFHFPDFPKDAPLIIDCTTPTYSDCMAHYKTGKHIIEFVKNLHDNPNFDNYTFTELLAHELTHAEQDTTEIHKLAKENGYRYHQIHILMEAQAFAKGKKIQGMLKGEKWFASENENIYAVEREIQRLRTDRFYRNLWGKNFPIKKEDKVLTSIPTDFHLSNNLLSSICEFPRDVLNPEFKDIDEIREDPEKVYTYFLHEMDDKKRFSSADLLLDKMLFNENATAETLFQDLEMIDFIINLSNSEGKPIFSENDLKDRFFFKEAMEGIEESKLLKELEKSTDSEGKFLFSENFSEKAKGMSISEFSKCIQNYLKVVDPVLDLVETEEKQVEETSPRSNLCALLKEASCRSDAQKDNKTSAKMNANLLKNRRQADR